MHDLLSVVFYVGLGLSVFSLFVLILDRSVWTTGNEARNFIILILTGCIMVLSSYVLR